MGWWKISNVESGGIDMNHTCPRHPNLSNAIVGCCNGGLYNGDGPADLMGEALRKINKEYEDMWSRPAKKEELTAVFNFCCNGMFAKKEGSDQ